ncbi:porin [Roseateles koreensis]|uniref:Porin n=1 Tax=Roseateles koreensis TaxID=2987526 RepID=A0ABT5KQY7_9BURK|nr:porin [Roseateles koreensis]MDC8785251.1 porin [Roseateles koreensis]
MRTHSLNPTLPAALTLCALAMGLATSSGQALAQISPDSSTASIYGFLKANVEQVSTGATATVPGQSLNRLSNDLSLLGFRVTEDLGDGFTAWGQIETNVKVDTGDAPWGGRNTAVGLRGRWGEILMGQWETPLRFVSVYAIDPFTASLFASNSIMGNGFVTAANGVSPNSFDRRAPNLLQYSSPDLQGWQGRLAYAVSEEKTATTAPDLLSSLITYSAGPLYLAWGHEIHRDYFVAGSHDSADRLGAAYSWGSTRLRASWERLHYEPKPGTHLDRNAWQVAATHDMGPWQWRVSHVHADASTGNFAGSIGSIGAPGSDSGASQWALGGGYNLSRRTEIWAGWTFLKNGSTAAYKLSANPFPGQATGQDAKGWGLGMTHKF